MLKRPFSNIDLTMPMPLWPVGAMKLSERILGLTGGGSDGWDVYRKARAMKAAGEDVIELTVGEHDRQHRAGNS